MNKKKLLGICLPLLGSAVIVGAGFSAWVFTSEIEDVTVTGTVTVTDKIVPQFEATLLGYNGSAWAEMDSFNLQLDQGGIANSDDDSVGVTAYTTSVDTPITQLAVEFNYATGSTTLSLTDYTVTFSNIALTTGTGTVANYVTQTVSIANATSGDDLVASKTGSGTVVASTAGADWTWAYASNQKPTTETAYDTMKTAINGQTITLTLSADVAIADA